MYGLSVLLVMTWVKLYLGPWLICRAGIDLATVEVRMEKLTVQADIAVGSRGNPTVTNTLRNMAEVMHYTVLPACSFLKLSCWLKGTQATAFT